MELPLLRRLVDELADRLRDTRVDQVYALPRHHLALVLGLRGAPRLWFSAEPEDPHLYLRRGAHPTPARPPAFAMAVRKHARGRRLESIDLVGDDRVVELRWAGAEARLILELVPRRATALLLDATDRVIAVWNPRRGRPAVGSRYSVPKRRQRSDPLSLSATQWRRLLSGSSEREHLSSLQSTVEGLSKSLARECLARCRAGEPLRTATLAELERASHTPTDAVIYAPQPLDTLSGLPRGDRLLLSPYPLPASMGTPIASFETLCEAAAVYYPQRARLRLLDRSRTAIATAVRGRRARVARARDRVLPQPDTELAIAELRRHADLLLAHPDADIAGDVAIVPDDYADSRPVQIRIRPELDRVANAERLYRRAQRLQRKATFDRRRLTNLEQSLTRLDELIDRLPRLRSLAAVQRLAHELSALKIAVRVERLRDIEAGAPDGSRSPLEGEGPAQPSVSPPEVTASYGSGIRVVVLPNGAEVLIGRSAKANDRLTHRVAAPRDWWLHADGPGSHVVLRNPRRLTEPPSDALMAAAAVAAWFSRSRSAASVEVHWTRIADLRRPRGAAPGRVLMTRRRSLRVRPQPPEVVQKAQASEG